MRECHCNVQAVNECKPSLRNQLNAFVSVNPSRLIFFPVCSVAVHFGNSVHLAVSYKTFFFLLSSSSSSLSSSSSSSSLLAFFLFILSLSFYSSFRRLPFHHTPHHLRLSYHTQLTNTLHRAQHWTRTRCHARLYCTAAS